MGPERKDLPPLAWLYFPPLAALVVLAADLFNWPVVCEIMLRRDAQGGGVLEWATPLVLLPGIGAAAVALRHLGGHPRQGLIRTWIAAWILVCCYFAGEEINWGQWLFGWQTPEAFLRFNDQQEMNLHNMSNFLDQTPRAFIEAFIFFLGLMAPLWRRVTGRTLHETGIWAWLLPTHVGMVTALIWSAAQLTDWSGVTMDCLFNDSELREFYIATFLSLYLLSIWRRARRFAR